MSLKPERESGFFSENKLDDFVQTKYINFVQKEVITKC